MDQNLMPYAVADNNQQAIARIFENDSLDFRTAFMRDRDRIIHSTAFRRLMHKTQVMRNINMTSDHYRNRLIHSIEVAQIARTISYYLKLNCDLTEAIALAHDLGHPPFGHAGEDALQDMIKESGGFDHNAHAFLLITEKEKQYIGFDGLNLCWATIEGLIKHNGPICDKSGKLLPKFAEAPGSFAPILELNKKFNLRLDSYSSLEAQVAAIADDIAYNSHDMDDAIRAEIIKVEDLRSIAFFEEIIEALKKDCPNFSDFPQSLQIKTITRKQIATMIYDVIKQIEDNIKSLAIESLEDVWECNQQLVTFSPQMALIEKEIKSFLYDNFYRSERIMEERAEIATILKTLFDNYFNNPDLLPKQWKTNYDKIAPENEASRKRLICYYIAGMTDSYAKNNYDNLTKSS